MRAVAGGFAGCSQCTQLSVLLVDIMLVLPDSSCSPSFALLVLVLVPVLLLCPGPLHLLVMDDDPTCVDKLTIVDARLLLFLLRAGKRTIPPAGPRSSATSVAGVVPVGSSAWHPDPRPTGWCRGSISTIGSGRGLPLRAFLEQTCGLLVGAIRPCCEQHDRHDGASVPSSLAQ